MYTDFETRSKEEASGLVAAVLGLWMLGVLLLLLTSYDYKCKNLQSHLELE